MGRKNVRFNDDQWGTATIGSCSINTNRQLLRCMNKSAAEAMTLPTPRYPYQLFVCTVVQPIVSQVHTGEGNGSLFADAGNLPND